MNDTRIPPARTDDQRMSALQDANKIRSARAADKKRMKKRELDPRTILDNPPIYWETARVADLIRAIPGVGHTKVERMLRTLHISASKTLVGMTDNQRSRLRESIDHYCTKFDQ